MTDEFIPVASMVDDRPKIGFRLPSQFHGVVALVEQDRVFVADIQGKGSVPIIENIAEGRIEPKDDRPSTFAEDMGYALSEVLDSCGFPKKNIIIALPNSLFSMDILTLPAVGRKNLESLIHRKILRSKMGGGEHEAWSYEILEEKRTEPDGGARVLIARTPASWLLKFHSVLDKYKIKPARITVPLAGVIHLMKTMDAEGDEESVLAIEASSGDAVLSIFMNRHLHQIRILKDGVNADRERFNYILQVELQRTQAFHKGKFKGKSINKALVLGSHAGCVDVNKVTLPLDLVSTNIQSMTEDKLTERESQTEEGLLCLMTGLILAGGKRRDKGERSQEPCLNFTPPRRQTASIAAVLAILMVLALAGVVALSSHLEHENNLLTLELDRLEEELLPMDLLEGHRDRLHEWNGYFDELGALYDDMSRDRRNVAESLLVVQKQLPSRTLLRSIDYAAGVPGGAGPSGRDRIRLQVEGNFTGSGSRNFMDFIHSMKASRFFRDTRFQMGGGSRSRSQKGEMIEIVDVELILK